MTCQYYVCSQVYLTVEHSDQIFFESIVECFVMFPIVLVGVTNFPSHSDEVVTGNEPIETDKPVAEIRNEPYSLPGGFHWETLDINNPMQVRASWTTPQQQQYNRK